MNSFQKNIEVTNILTHITRIPLSVATDLLSSKICNSKISSILNGEIYNRTHSRSRACRENDSKGVLKQAARLLLCLDHQLFLRRRIIPQTEDSPSRLRKS